MPRRLAGLCAALASTLALASAAGAQLVINEIDYDQIGTDAAEFVELYNPGALPVPLAGYTLDLVNGSGGGASVYQSYDLSPGVMIAAGDFFVVCANSATVANCDLDVSPETNMIQNGSPDAVALVLGGSTIVDTVSYEGDTGAPYTEGTGTTAADSNTVEGSLIRCPDGLDTNVNDDDFDFTATITPGLPNCGGGGPAVSISDVSAAEGDSGTTSFIFTISVTGSPAGTVTFEATVNDGTATVADGDYVDQNDVPLSIVPPATSVDFTVEVNGDTNVEPDETFTVTLANIVNADPGDVTGTGTIQNDDVVVTPIHDIQGDGSASPLVGQVVTTVGIVTAARSNGFFLQTPDAQADADPMTSEAIFVFTSSAPTVASGDEAQVTGTVSEYVPSADPQQPPLTELGNPGLGIVVLGSGQPLPSPIPLTPTDPDPTGDFDQLERLEAMRVSVATLRVVAPTLGSISETQATATTNGIFFGVVDPVARPFREAGVQLPDLLPPGSPPNVPRFDTNPEVLRVDSDGQVPPPVWAPLDVAVGGTVSGLQGVLDYAFRTYTILPDPVAAVTAAGAAISPATAPGPGDLTVASFNVQRFFDTVNDPTTSDPVLTPEAFERRISKLSLAVRDFLHLPDVVAVQEVENLTTLDALGTRIGLDAVANGMPDPEYVAYLVEGNDIGGIDVGFLVRGAALPGSPAVDRIENPVVTQIGALEELIDPDPAQPNALLNDRPPLVLEAVANFDSGISLPFTVIVVHQRSLSGIASEDPEGSCCGWTTVGERVRAKRLQQGEFVAAEIQARQTSTDVDERNVLVLGDFNAYEVNDGFVDVIGLVAGTPAPDDETVVPGDGTSPVSPALTLIEDQIGERYSFTFDGDAQQLDHALATGALAALATPTGDHARIDADFPVVSRQLDGTAERASDHDPLLVRLQPVAWSPGDVFRGDFESGDTRWWSATVP